MKYGIHIIRMKTTTRFSPAQQIPIPFRLMEDTCKKIILDLHPYRYLLHVVIMHNPILWEVCPFL
ncbi:hypothetical protein HanPI659440_Chr02g0081451 [Helianthus annuus]|nr:hypothetical protein HanPI659440_Chr02g0081451 [Helianthus annuus]